MFKYFPARKIKDKHLIRLVWVRSLVRRRVGWGEESYGE